MSTTFGRWAARWTLVAMIMWAAPGLGAEKDPIALSRVPEKTLKAAESVADGMRLRGASVERTDKGLVYHIRGFVDNKAYNIVVKPDGEVLRIEALSSATGGDGNGKSGQVPDETGKKTPSKDN